MERFYLENVARYHSLVNALDSTSTLRVSADEAGPNMVVGARIRPLSENEGFPSAIFHRPNQKNVVDVHDLYNHPRGTPILKVWSLLVTNA
jgi:kinesin family protein 2/24